MISKWNFVVPVLIILLILVCGCQAKPSLYSTVREQRIDAATENYRSGVEAINKGENREAIAALEKAIRIDPGIIDAYKQLSRAYYAVGDYEMGTYYSITHTTYMVSSDTRSFEDMTLK